MSYERALNEIQGLLTQTGIPPGHAQDITERLTTAMSYYYDYRSNGGGSSASNTALSASGDPNSTAFRNRYKSPEEARNEGPAGQAGKDGLGAYAWAVGATGAAGQGGQDGQQGQAGQDGITTVIGGGGGITIGQIKNLLDGLNRRISALERGTNTTPKPPECCKVLGSMIKKLEKKVAKGEEDISEIKKEISEAVDCP